MCQFSQQWPTRHHLCQTRLMRNIDISKGRKGKGTAQNIQIVMMVCESDSILASSVIFHGSLCLPMMLIQIINSVLTNTFPRAHL